MALSPDDIAYMQAHSDDSRSGDVIAAATLGLFISITGIILRFLARRKVNQNLRADDWWIIVAVCMDVAMKSVAWASVSIGFGKHVIFIAEENMRPGAILGLVSELLWLLVATPTKISILCLYNRLFNNRALFRWSLLIGFIVSAYSIAYGIALGFQTIPFRAQWTGEPSWNAKINALIGSVSALDVVTDVMIIASPIPQILKLNLNRQRKKELLGVFGVGTIVVVFGIVRTIFTSITPPSDPTYNSAKCEIWSLLQPSIGIFSACLPCLRPLLPERLGGSTVLTRASARNPSKRRATLDYELYSHRKDGWRVDEEATPRTFTDASRALSMDRTAEVPEKGIRVERNVEITYERNWTMDPSHSTISYVRD